MAKTAPTTPGPRRLRSLLALTFYGVALSLGMLGFAAPSAARQEVVTARPQSHLPPAGKQNSVVAGNHPGSSAQPVSGPIWSVISSPNTTTDDEPFRDAVTCSSAANCWAVGWYHTGSHSGSFQTYIEQWNGTAWIRVPSPNEVPPQGGTQNNFLNGISCSSESQCWAVGSYGDNVNQTLIERWDGSAWSIAQAPSLDYNALSSVTCTTDSDCWAVGYNLPANSDLAYRTLVEHWDGSSWNVITSSNTGSADMDFLSGVTCVSASDCWAVGYFKSSSSSHTQGLAEHWDGSTWSVISFPGADSTQSDVLTDVTCAASSDCWAAGSHQDDSTAQYTTLMAHWDGTQWSLVDFPNISGATRSNQLTKLTCTSSSNCWAVGYSYDANNGAGPHFQSLIAKWNGSTWSVIFSPNVYATQAVTCASASDCWAVGNFAEQWDGSSWTVVPTPLLTMSQSNSLNRVACISESQCWAVGVQYDQDGYGRGLIEQWTGGVWSVVDSPKLASSYYNTLYSVACVSESDCWAVGYNQSLISGWVPVMEHWNGSNWSEVTAPAPGNASVLSAVTCNTTTDCWAVGNYWDSQGHTLVEHWDGIAWSVVNSPDTDPHYNVLQSVTCTSSSNCWAVGTTTRQALIEHWDGTRWLSVSSQTPADDSNVVLLDVACVSSIQCWAVGYQSQSSPNQTLIEQWDGVSWSIVTSPNGNAFDTNVLKSVSCNSAVQCWAVGYYAAQNNAGPPPQQTLIEQWDGVSWSIFTSPNTTSNYNTLNGLACPSAFQCWSVGEYGSSERPLFPLQTLVERFTSISCDATCSTLLPVAQFTAGPHVIGLAPLSVSFDASTSTEPVGVPGTIASYTMVFGDGTPAVTQTTPLFSHSYADRGQYTTTLTVHDIAGRASAPVEQDILVGPPLISGAASRMIQGNAGAFDLDLQFSPPFAIESRSGGSEGNYTIIVSFLNRISDCGVANSTEGTPTAAFIGPEVNQCTEVVTGLPNATYVAVTLENVIDSQNNNLSASVQMGLLVGDTTGDGFVNSADIGETKFQSGQPVTSSNFREDVNGDGFINSADIGLVKSKSGTALP